MNTRNAEIRQLAKDITDFFRHNDNEIYFDFSRDDLIQIISKQLKAADMRKDIINDILLYKNSPASSSLIERITLLK